jgi:hypothetical protein
MWALTLAWVMFAFSLLECTFEGDVALFALSKALFALALLLTRPQVATCPAYLSFVRRQMVFVFWHVLLTCWAMLAQETLTRQSAFEARGHANGCSLPRGKLMDFLASVPAQSSALS